MENLKEIEGMNEFDLHMPSEALPIQVKQNKSVIGKISLSNYPTGARSGFMKGGNTEFEINVQNAQQMLLSSSAICCDVRVERSGNVAPDLTKDIEFRGGQTALKSLTISLDNKKLVDIQNHADKVASFVLESSMTKDELDNSSSTTAYKTRVKYRKIFSMRIDLKHFGCDIGNLIPTGTIGSTLRINGTINDAPITQLAQLDEDDSLEPYADSIVQYNNIRLESEFVELQPMLLNKRLEKIKSSSGLTIPFHTFTVDTRNLNDVNTSFNERIALGYNNIVSMYQIPYKKTKGLNYYSNLRWGATNFNDAVNYLVNFDGGQYYNLNSNQGQSGLASHAQALINASRTEFTTAGAGSTLIGDINNNQILACNFVRSNNVLSPSITDSGVNARLQSGIINTQCEFGGQFDDNTLVSIVKFTRRIVFKNGSMDVFS